MKLIAAVNQYLHHFFVTKQENECLMKYATQNFIDKNERR
jgi:hypothetical protein